MRTLTVLLLAFAFTLAATAAPGDLTPYLVKDINPESTPGSSDPRFFVTLGNLALFQVSKLGHRELWRSDGTESGTYRLAETGYTRILAVTGNLCFFRYDDASNPFQGYLWVTDGTLPGTFLLGKGSSYEPWAWVPSQGLRYFASSSPDQDHGTELWRSDGTPGGTYEVADIMPGWDSSDPRYLTSFKGRLYFAADNRAAYSALWRSDGTAQGTVQVSDVPAHSLQVVGPRLVFVGRDDSHGQELWASDGTTAGTRRITDLTKGEESPGFLGFKVVGKRLYFVADAGTAGGPELYVTDGTAQGIRRLTSLLEANTFKPIEQAALGNRLLFAANDGTHGMELWSTDGTPEETRMVLDACPGDCPSNPSSLFLHQGRLYYRATDGAHGTELWVTDGTAQATRMVMDICRGICDSSPSALASPAGPLFFTARTAAGSATGLWITDGTAAGTAELAEASPSLGTAAGDTFFFAGSDPDHGKEPWVSDGTLAGTHLLTDVADETIGGSDPSGLMRLGGNLLFFARGTGGTDGSSLFKSDGTEAGTVVVKPTLSGNGSWTASASRLFFQAVSSKGSSELWTSDGTAAGTYRLTPDGTNSLDALSPPVSRLGSRVFFSAESPDHGAEPWITDGTVAGTRQVADLLPGPGSSSPKCFEVFKGRAWFGALSRLWKSDGTTAGTFAFGPKRPGFCPFLTLGGRLLFTAERNSSVFEDLWSTDGTVAGTEVITYSKRRLAKPIVHRGRLWFAGKHSLMSTDGTAAGTGSLFSFPGDVELYQILSDGVRLYFSLWLYDPGVAELWVTDGTEAGSRKISDLDFVGPWAVLNERLYLVSGTFGTLYKTDGTKAGTRPVRPDGKPNHVTALLRSGNRLIAFTAAGEVWQTDGTAGGTKLVRDRLLARDPIMKAGNRLFFSAMDPETGWELWAMRE